MLFEGAQGTLILSENSFANFIIVANGGLSLTYAVPPAFACLKAGDLCLLTLGRSKKTVVGVFLEFCPKPSFSCVDMLYLYPLPISFDKNHLNLFFWISEYYLTPLGKVMHLLAPGFLWNPAKFDALQKRWDNFENEKTKKIKGEIYLEPNSHIELNTEQNAAYENIFHNAQLPTLLHGVTGSGKTEVYLKCAQKVILQGKKVLVLVPEIALTPQMSARFRRVFGDDLAVLHSGLNATDGMREWLKVFKQTAKIVLGVRTAIFCPLQNIGLILVDEEHDSSYKSSEMPCTHSRDVAVVRAKKEGAICVLGSATPSLESYANVQLNKYNFVQLKEKFSLNVVDSFVINAKEEFDLSKKQSNIAFLRSSVVEFHDSGISSVIVNAIKENKEKNQQSMVLINRRGYVNYALCSSCATPLSCPKCSVSTTLHQQGRTEICHYCGFQTPLRKICLKCGGHSFFMNGIGTQNVEEKLQNFLPQLKISRIDRDVMTSNTRLTKIIEDFRTGEIDCLVGTQLLAKGHDFARVTLVVLLHLEDSLFLPDFRSAERTFQLILQSMGRAGRGIIPGRVLLQSFVTNHPVVKMALEHKCEEFLERELKMRKLAWHPPFSRQILFQISHTQLKLAQQLGENLRNLLVSHWKTMGFAQNEIRLAGPYEATIAKMNNEFRYQLCLNFNRNLHPKNITPKEIWLNKDFLGHLKIDVDPLSFL